MSLTAFLVAVGDGIQAEDWPDTEASASRFLSGLTKQPTFRHEMPGAVVLQSSVYPDESDVAVVRWSDAEVELTVVFDGWIENRQELLQAAGLALESSARPDGAIVAECFARLGPTLFRRMYGEFSGLILRRSHRRSSAHAEVLGFRDKVGVRPLYFSQIDRVVVASNFPAAAAIAVGVESSPDYAVCAEFLSADLTTTDGSLFQSVMRLKSGHYFSYGDGSALRVCQYWRPASGIARQSASDVRMTVRQLVDAAVAAACPKTGHFGIHISGGIDSSCIAASAGGALRDGSLATATPVGLFQVYSQAGMDERSYVSDLAPMVPFDIVQLTPHYLSVQGAFDATQTLRYPYLSFAGSCSDRHSRHLRDMGGRVALDGEGGDELFYPTPYALWRSLAREGASAVGTYASRRRMLADHLGLTGRRRSYFLVSPWLPSTVTRALERWYFRLHLGRATVISPELARKVDLSRRFGGVAIPGSANSLALALALNGYWSMSFDFLHAASFLAQVERRHPLSSARLLEYVNTLGLEHLDQPGYPTRLPLRAAFADLLPNSIRTRTDKAEFSPSVAPALLLRTEQVITAVAQCAGALYGLNLDNWRGLSIWEMDALQAYLLWQLTLSGGTRDGGCRLE